MWPKVLAQLLELLPHITRLVPMADAFFASRTATQSNVDKAAAAIHEDLGRMTASHESLYRQLQEQGTEIAALGSEVHRTRIVTDEHTDRLARLEQQQNGLQLWVRAAVVLLLLAVILLVVVLIRQH